MKKFDFFDIVWYGFVSIYAIVFLLMYVSSIINTIERM